MNNILPKVSKKASSSRVEESFFSNWKLHAADPKTTVIPSYLQSEFTPDPEELKVYRDEPVKSRREPNFVSSEVLNSLEPSPLDNVARGIPDPIGPVILESKHIFSLNKSTYKPPKPEKVVDLVICVENRLLSGLDIFMQRSGSIKNFRLQSNQQCIRSLTGAQPPLPQSDQLTSLHVLCSTAKRCTVVTTSRQEVKTWTFYTDSKIGLEVEVLYGRLVVSKVLPETQAAPMELHLDGAEILAVNSQRVV
ncbi:hypothetical protein EON65_22325 [archaeon]|nr:MAG: hypothetical protein EON65_22325 [archaeon]